MASKKKSTALQQLFFILVYMLIGAVLGVFIVQGMERMDAQGYGMGQTLLLAALLCMGFYIGFYVQIALHEAGHLVFGLLTGYRFSSYRIESLMWIRDGKKLRFKRFSLAGTGGQCLMIPPDMKDEQLPFVLYNLGGLLVNLCASIICFVLYAHFPQMLLVSPLLCLTGSIGVAFALLNGIPMNTGAVDNDGKNACSLGKHPAALHAFWVQMKVNEQLTRGKRLRDMPEEWFLFPAESTMQNSMVATLAVFACNRLSDEGRYEEADAQIERLLAMESGIIGVHRNLLVCDRIWYELTHQNRKEVVERLLTREQRSFMRTMKRFPSVIRTEYALAALFERDTAKAAATLALFERVAKHYPYPSDIESERELLRLVADKTV